GAGPQPRHGERRAGRDAVDGVRDRLGHPGHWLRGAGLETDLLGLLGWPGGGGLRRGHRPPARAGRALPHGALRDAGLPHGLCARSRRQRPLHPQAQAGARLIARKGDWPAPFPLRQPSGVLSFPMPERSTELLAPAGNWECARAAVANGADAIYFGLPRFNARLRADNFTAEDLPELMRFLHAHGVRGFVAFNTLVFPAELEAAAEQLRLINEA